MLNASVRRKGYLAAAAVVICWSGFNIVSRLAGKSALTPYDLAALRFGVAGLLLLPVSVRVCLRADWVQFSRFLAVSCCGGLGYALLAYTGFSLAPAAHAAVLVNGGIPVATALIAWLALRQKPDRRGLMALLVALCGIVLIGVQSLTFTAANPHQWFGDLAFVLAAVAWACTGLMMRHWRLPPLETAAMTASLAALLYLPVYGLFLPKHLLLVGEGLIILQAVYQGIVAAILAGVFYNYANQTIGPQQASLMLTLVPGITAVAAVSLLNEPLTPLILVGVVLVSAGALMGTRRST